MGGMKALSRKRGRPRKEGVIRTESGQPSRAKDPPSRLALEVRAFHTGLTIDEAKDQLAATWVGQLLIAYKKWERKGRSEGAQQPEASISSAQFDGLSKYRELHASYLRAIGAPGAYYESSGIGDALDEDEMARKVAATKSRYEAARKAIQDRQNHYPGNLWAALDLAVIRDQKMAHMVGDLRTLGNVLANHFNGSRKA